MLERVSACPSCSEPPAAGDRYCGACGADLTAAVREGEGGGGAVWPAAPGNGAVPGTPSVPPPPVSEDPAVEPDFTLAPAQRPGEGTAPGLPVPPPGPPVPPPGPPPPLHSGAAGAAGAAGGDGAGGPAGASEPPVPPHVPPPPPPPPAVVPPHVPDAAPSGTAMPPGPGAGPPAPHSEPSAGPHSEPPPGPDPRTADPRVTVDDSPQEGGSEPRCVACGTGAVDGDGYCDHCGHQQPRERDHMESELASVAAASDRGLRHHRNEDFFSLHEVVTPAGAPASIAVVCDGVSSATRPDDASAAAARAAGASVCGSLPQGMPAQQAMHNALLAASDAVTALAAEGPNEPSKNAPACTIVGAITVDGILTVGWIGDSRAYWVPEEQGAPPARLTEDDSWAAQMVAAGLMTEDEAYADARAHAITGWLGADAYEVEPHTASYKPEGAGVVVVCTDGVWNYAESAEQMAAAVPADGRRRPLQAAQRLVGFALDGGGHDNATVAVIPFPGTG